MNLIRCMVLCCFISSCIGPIPAHANSLALPLSSPNAVVGDLGTSKLLAPTAFFKPMLLKGLKVFPDKPFKMDFLIDPGEDFSKEQSTKLIKYFLAGLTIPNGDLWVNLSPYEKNRIIPESFSQTAMGVDVLSQDYILKQLTASLIYPESEIGKIFWQKVYAQAQQRFGTTNIPINTFNKVWIVPEEAVVYENKNVAYIAQAKLKVMLEEDYLAQSKNETLTRGHVQDRTAENVSPSTMPSELALSAKGGSAFGGNVKASQGKSDSQAIGSQIVREVVIPILEREVNEGAHFAQLRQVYSALILATWYKKKIKESLIAKAYVDQKKTYGLQLSSPNASVGDPKKSDIESIYQQYIQTFKKGVFNYIKEEPVILSPEGAKDLNGTITIPRKYFAGGAGFDHLSSAMRTMEVQQLPDSAQSTSTMMLAHLDFAMNNEADPHNFRIFAKFMERTNHELNRINGAIQLIDMLGLRDKVQELMEILERVQKKVQIQFELRRTFQVVSGECVNFNPSIGTAVGVVTPVNLSFQEVTMKYRDTLNEILRIIDNPKAKEGIGLELSLDQRNIFTLTVNGIERLRRFLISSENISQPFIEEMNIHSLLNEFKDMLSVSINLPNPDFQVFVDRGHLEGVLDNLITNAQRAIIGKEKGEVVVSVARSDHYVEIKAQDNGLGLAPERVARFNAGGTLESTKSPDDPGEHGIGTQTIGAIVEAHGGKITVESQEGVGSIFTILLPMSNVQIISSWAKQMLSEAGNVERFKQEMLDAVDYYYEYITEALVLKGGSADGAWQKYIKLFYDLKEVTIDETRVPIKSERGLEIYRQRMLSALKAMEDVPLPQDDPLMNDARQEAIEGIAYLRAKLGANKSPHSLATNTTTLETKPVEGYEAKKLDASTSEQKGDSKAQASADKQLGGIDLNPLEERLQTKGGEAQLEFPANLDQASMAAMAARLISLTPSITSIEPNITPAQFWRN